MQNLFLILISGLFLVINARIIFSDIREKKIPNVFLLALLLLLIPYYGFLFLILGDYFLISEYILRSSIALSISFLLYLFWIWSAWDAKYLFVLSLFLYPLRIETFVLNVSLLTIISLWSYFIYFYILRFFVFPRHWIQLIKNIYIDISSRVKLYFQNHENPQKINNRKHIFYKIWTFLWIFLLFYVSIRLLRMEIFYKLGNIQSIQKFISEHFFYVLIAMYVLFYWLYRYIPKYFQIFVHRLYIHFWFKDRTTYLVAYIFLYFLMGSYIVYELIKNPVFILHNLFLIFTVYLGIFFMVKIIWYLYKITFFEWESQLIHINTLKSWVFVDKQFLLKWFSGQNFITTHPHVVNGDLENFIQKIKNPLDEESVENIQKLYLYGKKYHKNRKTPQYQYQPLIKIFKTFAFAPYIFSGAIVTYFYGNMWYTTIIDMIFKIIKSH